jgi:hypothetical protein
VIIGLLRVPSHRCRSLRIQFAYLNLHAIRKQMHSINIFSIDVDVASKIDFFGVKLEPHASV